MKLVIDSKIPFIKGYAELLGETRYIAGAAISANDVKDADVLIIRTRTHCNQQLLEGSNVKFIATATIGYDHIDTQYLAQASIHWTNCPGCNATSVAQYVRGCLLNLALDGCWNEKGIFNKLNATTFTQPDACKKVFSKLTLGIVGVGHVGTQVMHMAQTLGFGRILLCDPPRAEQEGRADFVSLTDVATQADVITFHTPLTQAPTPHATYHLANAAFFEMLKPHAVVINSSRGEVVDTLALKNALRNNQLRAAIIDTWENEPHIDRELLADAYIATPHIAGYSADGKANGTRMALQAVAHYFGIDSTPFNAISASSLPTDFCYYPQGYGAEGIESLRLYDPKRDSIALKTHPEDFEALRGNYPLRREK